MYNACLLVKLHEELSRDMHSKERNKVSFPAVPNSLEQLSEVDNDDSSEEDDG